ncbi:M48 family metallopeptidase [Acidithiobacillus caldus]
MLRGRVRENHLVWRGLEVRVLFKPNRHSYLRIRPPGGDIEVTAPHGMPLSAVLALLHERRAWIDTQRARLLATREQGQNRFTDGERIRIFGVPHPLRVRSGARSSAVRLVNGELQLWTQKPSTAAERARLLQSFYHDQLALRIAPLVEMYRRPLGLTEVAWHIRPMKTRWGSCSTRTRRITLNLELIHHPEYCLEYVVVHELVHFHERLHNHRFYSQVEALLPQWQEAHRHLRSRHYGE